MNGEKFLFDQNMFDEDPVAGLEEEEIARPEFTKDELEAAKNNAFQDGVRAGIKESEASLTKATLTLVQKIERDMSVLFAAEHDRSTTYESEAVHLSLSIIQKLFPLYMQEHGEEELRAAIKTSLAVHDTPENIRIDLHGDILKNLNNHIEELGSDLHKKITLKANNNLNKNECNIMWDNGGIICNREDIAEKTFQIMKETLAERGISVHDETGNNKTIKNKTIEAAGES